MNLGRAFRDGNGVEANQIVAMRLFRQVCSRTPVPGSDEDAANIARACSLAGTALLFGNGVQRNIREGLTLLEKGCAAAGTFGCYNLGTITTTGPAWRRTRIARSHTTSARATTATRRRAGDLRR